MSVISSPSSAFPYTSPSSARQTSRMSRARSRSSALPVAASIELKCASASATAPAAVSARSRMARTITWLNSGSRATDLWALSTSASTLSPRASSRSSYRRSSRPTASSTRPTSASTSTTPESASESGRVKPPIAKARPAPMPGATAVPGITVAFARRSTGGSLTSPIRRSTTTGASSTRGSVLSMKTLSDSTAHAASRPTATMEQGSPWWMSRPTIPRTLLALAAWPVRWLASDRSAVKRRATCSSALAGRACIPLASGQVNRYSNAMGQSVRACRTPSRGS